jgi:hypothetical protein
MERTKCPSCETGFREIQKLKSGNESLRATCQWCRKKNTHYRFAGKKKYKRFKKDSCEICFFIPVHSGQLDVDHIDGNNKNNESKNLMTLCANCHRLKTIEKKDYLRVYD